MPPRPPISPEKRKERYLEAVRDKMTKLYAFGEARPPAREQLSYLILIGIVVIPIICMLPAKEDENKWGRNPLLEK